MKTCTKCGQTKPLEAFRTHAGRSARAKAGKVIAACKDCLNKYVSEYRIRKQGAVVRYESRRLLSTQVQARRQLKEAVRLGRITKPESCQGCGKLTVKEQLHGHHTDYSKPLDVQWLCSTCHGKQHRHSVAMEAVA